MEIFKVELLGPVITQLGIGGIFLYLFIKEREYGRTAAEAKEQRIKEKDENIRQMTQQVFDVVQKNTEVNTELKNVVQNNTEMVQSLTERVYDVLTHKRK